jgi:class 3 adenylate cyclase
VDELNDCFCHFDWVVGKYGCEKLKTIGDGYLAVCGLPDQRPDAAMQLLKAAMDIRDEMEKHYEERVKAGHESWHVRIGLHIGPLVAGVVGVRRIAYDIWGDTVNTASRIESAGEPGRINVSRAFYDKVADQVLAEPRGEISCKNKGPLEMFFINGLREEVTA